MRHRKGGDRERMKRLLPIALSLMLLTGCAVSAALPDGLDTQPEPPISEAQSAPTPSPSPSPEPEVYRASVGIVGDILMMTSQIQGAKTAAGYDFKPSFYAMQPLFSSVDIMAGNFECTLAGEAAGYTQRRPAAPPPTEDDPNPKQPYQTFNAPDELAADLRAVGFDLLTTANNHCLDRGKEGLFRTARTLRGAGLVQTGTYLTEEERENPCIMTAGGIAFGFVAMTESVNSYDARLGGDRWAVGRVSQQERIQREIESCKSAGADVVIAFPHWGEQYMDRPVRRQREYAQRLADWGADAVIGSHPHCPEPFEWITAEDGRRVPVAYSMSNFISNMSGQNTEYGLFLRLDVQKGEDGISIDMSYLPTACIIQGSGGRRVHQPIPCWEQEQRRGGLEPLSDSELKKTQRAFDHVTEICGLENAGLIEWTEEYDKQA